MTPEPSDPASSGSSPMRLRGDAPRVTRLSRKFLLGLCIIGCVGLGIALILALQSRENKRDPGDELYSTDNRPAADGLAGLPHDYTGPRLGPPLPGDLGRPFLAAQNRDQPEPTPVVTPMPTPSPALSADEQRRLQEIEAARASRLFAGAGPRTAEPATNANAEPPQGQAPAPAPQDEKTAFLNAPVNRNTVSLERVAQPASPNILLAGSVIPAALITGIRSDLPGQITAQVTENIYDSPTGRTLLIPQGARLIGQYDNGIGFGQSRVLLVWNRILFPNGRSIVLERQPGADAEGYAGLEDEVDYHWGQLFKAALLSTLLSVSTEVGSSDNDDSIARALRQGASDSISRTGQQIVSRQLDIAPTLTIRPGFPVRVIVTQDLVVEPYGG